MNALLDQFDAVYIVNLAIRTDRRREMSAQLRSIGAPPDHPKIHWLAARKPADAGGFPTVGAHGCYLSHMSIIRMAVERGQQRVLLLEDDLDFSKDFLARQTDAIAAMQSSDWSFFYACHTIDLQADSGGRPWLQLEATQRVAQTHWVALQGAVLPELLAHLEAVLRRPPGHPDGGPMHVDGAYSRFRAAHPGRQTLFLRQPLGCQRASRTDIHALPWFDRYWGVRSLASFARRRKNA